MDIITYALCQANDKKLEDLIKSMEGLSTVILDHVPTVSEAEPNKLYLVDVNHDGVYEEYILAEIDGQEQIVELGAFVDLSNYYTKTETDTLVGGVHSELTSQAYDQLPAATKTNGTEYFVFDSGDTIGKIYRNGHRFGGSDEIDADDVDYDNTASSLSATNVQDAIDEVFASGAKHVSLTQVEYDLLTPEEKNNGTEYFITDSESEADISGLENRVTSVENRVLKLEGNFVDITANLQMINPAAYKQVTKVSDNEVYFIVEDPVTEKDYKVTITAQGTGDTRTNPTYTIVEVVPNAEVGD